MKQIMLGIKQYRQDNDDYLPLVSVDPAPKGGRKNCMDGPTYGWADALQPFLKSTCIYQCPSNVVPPSSDMYTEHSGYIDYWFNARLSHRKTVSSTTITLGEGDGYGNARASKSGFPPNWQTLPEDVWFRRHLGGANYAFIDGHVKWLLPEKVVAGEATFLP